MHPNLGRDTGPEPSPPQRPPAACSPTLMPPHFQGTAPSSICSLSTDINQKNQFLFPPDAGPPPPFDEKLSPSRKGCFKAKMAEAGGPRLLPKAPHGEQQGPRPLKYRHGLLSHSASPATSCKALCDPRTEQRTVPSSLAGITCGLTEKLRLLALLRVSWNAGFRHGFKVWLPHVARRSLKGAKGTHW